MLNQIYPQKAASTESIGANASKEDVVREPSTDARTNDARTSDDPSNAEDCEGDAAAGAPCPCEKSVTAGATVYAVQKLKTRDGNEVEAGREGVVIEVSCDPAGPAMFLVRWGKQTPSWHDATEISTHSSVPF